MPKIIATSRKETHGFSKQPQTSLRLIAGEGVEGDAHRGSTTQHLYLKRKDAAQPNLAQVLHIGPEAVLEVTGLRTPCSQIEDHRAGLQEQLWGERDATGKRARRAGIMSIVRTGGLVHPEDAIRIELPPEPHRPLGPV
jgi:hypothetical protein